MNTTSCPRAFSLRASVVIGLRWPGTRTPKNAILITSPAHFPPTLTFKGRSVPCLDCRNCGLDCGRRIHPATDALYRGSDAPNLAVHRYSNYQWATGGTNPSLLEAQPKGVPSKRRGFRPTLLGQIMPTY